MLLDSQNQPIELFFKKAYRKDMLHHAYLFEGPDGTGKSLMARHILKDQYCQADTEDGLACNECSDCKRIEEGQHPDVIELRAEGATIKVDQVRELISQVSKTGIESSRHGVIIHDAEKMTTGAANSLLKFLEEPEGQTTIFLLTTALNRLLPTIVSRSQVISFKPSHPTKRRNQLLEAGIPEHQADILTYLTQDTEQANELYQDDEFQNKLTDIRRLKELLDAGNGDAFVYVQTNIIPNFRDRKQQQVALEMLLADYRLELHKTYLNKSASDKNSQTKRKSVENITIVLEALKMFQHYVPAQSVFEFLSLEILAHNS